MAENSALILTSLDFDTLKNNLKSYLQSQTVFKDYDFEGSNMNVMLSVLAYNTYINSFYLNMVATESFLDTAQLPDSVVSHAKLLNYTPASFKSPKAVIDITYTALADSIHNNFLIPKGAQFSGTNANGTFTYVTDRNHSASSKTTDFVFKSIPIYEGSYINETLVVDSTVENQRFVLSNPTIDVDSINITVFENGSTTSTDYVKVDTLYGLMPNSYIYFVQAYQDNYEIVFGDNVFGYRPRNNATVLATYRITSGTSGGGVTTFLSDQDLGAYNGGAASSVITTVNVGDAGANSENIDTIRFRAPRAFQTQGRAITKNDYKTLILGQFTEIKTLNVYGGENTSGVATGINYSKIYISPITYAGTALSNDRKADVVNFIKDKMTIGLNPIIIDPDIVYIVCNLTVTYSDATTNYTPADITSLVYTTVQSFNDTYLKDFDIAFRYSKFLQSINNTDASVLAANVATKIKKIISPPLFKSTSVDINFHQQIKPGTVYSSQFLVVDGLTYSLTDYNPNNSTFVEKVVKNTIVVDNTSNLVYLKLNDITKQLYIAAGNVDYENGIVSLNALRVANFLGNIGIEIFAETADVDIFAKNNDLIEVDMDTITIDVRIAK